MLEQLCNKFNEHNNMSLVALMTVAPVPCTVQRNSKHTEHRVFPACVCLCPPLCLFLSLTPVIVVHRRPFTTVEILTFSLHRAVTSIGSVVCVVHTLCVRIQKQKKQKHSRTAFPVRVVLRARVCVFVCAYVPRVCMPSLLRAGVIRRACVFV